MHQTSQQELCLKLRQTVRHLQSLITERDREQAALAEELLEAQQKHSERETELHAAQELASQAETRANRLEEDLKDLRDEFEHDRRDVSADLTAELQVRCRSRPLCIAPMAC